ncbi:protein Skeletor, isoforms B/C-like [Limulus polyphemus]|uniref:Protein Skeletor, isoforms B/C-like n=1 Tax=Limulus polyphemus TaxID=6850 RepID=A0ABM1BFH0_LIMPO|nr:protein Skeletor, isoforms B/C-like [Limulus polyphemus]
MIPNGFQPPKEYPVGAIPQFGHGTHSGTVVIKDVKTIFVPNLYYDGAAPDAFFLVGKGQPNPKGTKVPDENGSLKKLSGYQGKNVTLRLPGDITVFDIEWFGLYCISFEENFGHVNIPDHEKLNIPADLQALKTLNFQFHNCEEIFPGKMQVSWKIEGEDIYIQLEGKLEENEYMGFGRSGDDNKAKMIGADITLVFYDGENSLARAVDYLLTSKAQCSKGSGVCLDVKLGGKENSQLVSWEKVNGILKVTYKRPLYTGDTQDQSIPEAGEITVVAAIGPLNSQNEAAFHTHFYTKHTIRIDFGRTPASKCSSLLGGMSEKSDKVKVWPPQKISGVSTFEARIGPTGGDKGYTPITGHQSWGIAWWINDLLIPEITVERGKNYTFIVEGGSDPTNTAEYHPLYITNNAEGGGGQFLDKLGSAEHKIYAGVETEKGTLKPIGVGRLCEWKHKTIDMSATSETFEDYKQTLELKCKDGKPGKFVWLPDDDTPDLVYYQCFTHRNLGWKIHVTGGKNHARRQVGNGATSSLVHQWLLISIATLVTIVLKY